MTLSTMFSIYEQPILAYLAAQPLSASHSLEHVQTVLTYAKDLQAIYGGNQDTIAAAVLLHDLGRNDTTLHGTASAGASVQMATTVLVEVAFPPSLLANTLQAIQEHDQPAIHPTTIEGRILKDADFLAGFGATGILRSALWTGESGGTIEDLLQRLETKMAARIASLEFAQSRYTAQQEYIFVRLFLDELRKPAGLRSMPTVPYIIIEGISGSGKSTQAQMLVDRFKQEKQKAVLLHEPTDWFTQQKQALSDSQRDPVTLLHLFLSDRLMNLRKEIATALAHGTAVVASRSYLSTMVYQQCSEYTPAMIAILHRMMPQPTYIFLLDLSPKEALRRIERREHGAQLRQRGAYEYADQLRVHRERFLQLKTLFPQMDVIDTHHASPKGTSDLIWQKILAQSDR